MTTHCTVNAARQMTLKRGSLYLVFYSSFSIQSTDQTQEMYHEARTLPFYRADGLHLHDLRQQILPTL